MEARPELAAAVLALFSSVSDSVFGTGHRLGFRELPALRVLDEVRRGRAVDSDRLAVVITGLIVTGFSDVSLLRSFAASVEAVELAPD